MPEDEELIRAQPINLQQLDSFMTRSELKSKASSNSPMSRSRSKSQKGRKNSSTKKSKKKKINVLDATDRSSSVFTQKKSKLWPIAHAIINKFGDVKDSDWKDETREGEQMSSMNTSIQSRSKVIAKERRQSLDLFKQNTSMKNWK